MTPTKKLNFSKYSSFKIGGVFDVALLDRSTPLPREHYLIGGCNNILIGNNPPPLAMFDKSLSYIRIDKTAHTITIGGATPSGQIASFCKKNNIANFEFLSHLPGKLGGLVFMNAGLKEYEISNHLIDVELASGRYPKKQIDFGYRSSNINEPILEATFKLYYGYDAQKTQMFKQMRSNQPSTPSAGSCFKNPPNDYAGRLIEAVGLKGKKVGNMAFSEQHANFLVNFGGGRFEDAINLIEDAKKRVFQEFGITLELEIVILDRAYL